MAPKVLGLYGPVFFSAAPARMRDGLAHCAESDKVRDVRVLGAIGVVELNEQPDQRSLQKSLVDKGVWIRPFGRLVYIMPAYSIGSLDLEKLFLAISGTVQEL